MSQNEKALMDLIEKVYAHANANYSSGWDLIAESYAEQDVAKALAEANNDFNRTIASLQEVVDFHAEQQESHDNEANSSY
jgi:hypothetical protein